MTKKMTANVDDFIDAVREYPVIYDRINAVTGLQANEEKANAWRKISLLLNEDELVLKAKWRNLRDSYQKAIKNRKELEEIGQLHRYHEYKHEEKLEFLYPHCMVEDTSSSRKRKSSSSFSSNTKSLKTEIPAQLFKVEEVSQEPSTYQSVEYLIDQEECPEEDIEEEDPNDIISKEENDKSYCYMSSDDQQADLVEEDTKIEKPKTEIDVWLESIKASMLKLTKLNQARAKRDINSILSNYEIEQLESQNS